MKGHVQLRGLRQVAKSLTAAKRKAFKEVPKAHTLVARHSPEDRVITLDVGGKEFRTLRSTVSSNCVLWDYVLRAEANGEFTKSGAVFIDRDPEHFPLVLSHLRNSVEGLGVSTAGGLGQVQTVQLTTRDRTKLRDIYVEAKHYKLEELKSLVCSTSLWAAIVETLGGGKLNPFDAMARVITSARSFMVAGGSVIAASFGFRNLDEIWETISAPFVSLIGKPQ
uniref:Potassium channel tetramerisation-type BTB domain-containing protein n=1 Tax=Mucochytrium quahogii TaxID=96639 RepID=A0A7S2W9U4_9STRA|mmetsp:Transcript_8144/g.13134  ORF Transcript_8144/g.13134 Transcript_8144/m.13134 type:complete len:223 (+) Transcript_8144:484-1152(+)|eukprot:CAMPEP_0203760050 /NCGR_PEP_ID=MMETSP0098-20131031/13436_1 /ASSEMBLY_ACC=CAM_ASM_000208 /TAXON_ID=96639 /ORGANISM=" , Strain NY0313808BC1" /LENGTH=222 /DNA_ID=CAMNT_0050653477 /DNA_START=469 /DNA_END=1137 /DNA_ORIENTATION=-